MATFEGLNALASMEGASAISRALAQTWFGASGVSIFLLAVFFARYPHKNGPLSNEVDSFYDCTYRGQGEVDLWMMGEGAHHMHHAKSDISYAYLQGICKNVEAKYPHLKLGARSNGDLKTLESGRTLPVRQTEISPPPMRFAIDRTESILKAKKLLGTDPTEAVLQIASAVLKSALHVCTTSDKGLLRRLHEDMRLTDYKGTKNHPFPFSTWQETVFAESTSRDLGMNANLIGEEVRKVSQTVGYSLLPMSCDEDIKAGYLDVFVRLGDALATPEQFEAYGKHCSEHFKVPTTKDGLSRHNFIERLRTHLESPVPSDFMRDKVAYGQGSRESTRRAVERLAFGGETVQMAKL